MSATKKRGYIQGQITKLRNSLDSITDVQLKNPEFLIELRAKLDYIENQRCNYFEIHETIISELTNDDAIAKEEKTLSHFVDSCDNLEIEIRMFIRKCKSNTEAGGADSEMISLVDKMISRHSQDMAKLMKDHDRQLNQLTKSEVKSNIKLSQLSLKPFNGEYTEWPSFHASFSHSVHNNKELHDIDKYQYLLNSLTGEARSVIKELPVSEQNYQVAWELLVKRFNKPKSILKEHFTRFFTQPELKAADVSKLRKLHSIYEESIRGAEQMGATNKDAWLIFFATQTLDPDTKELWSREKTKGDLPTWQEFSDFLSDRCDALESLSKPKLSSGSSSQPAPQKKPVTQSTTKQQKQSSFCNTNNEVCKICKAVVHHAWRCDKFLAKSASQRLKTLLQLQMCTNCLSPLHTNCERGSCRVCHQHHNTMIHDAFDEKVSAQEPQSAPKPSTSVDQPTHSEAQKASQSTQNKSSLATVDTQSINETTSSSDSQSFMTRITKNTLLPTVQVFARGPNGKLHRCRALLDSGSQVNFVTARFVDKLKLPKCQGEARQISGVNTAFTNVNQTADINISSTDEQFQMTANFMIVPKVVDEMPTDYIELNWKIPDHITLADPQYMIPGRIDLLLGAEFDARARRSGNLQDNSPALLETAFGWVVQGAWVQHQGSQELNNFLCLATFTDEMQQVAKFFEVEEVGQHDSSPLSSEEQECEDHFALTVKRNSEGRFIVRFPLRDNVTELGSSRFIAEQRFKQVEKKLNRNPILKQHYMDFMQMYLDLGHMRPLPDDYTSSQPEYYLPHHAVVRMSSSSTPVRVVFDASCKTTSGLSLNSVLKVGPRTQQDLFDILIRYRQYNFTIKADIEKMFRQVLMHEEDQNLQRILHRDDPTKPLQTFLLTTVTYGTASAPYLSTRCMKQLVAEDGDNYPHAKEVANRDFYVDDLLTGTQTIQEAVTLQEELVALFKGGGFSLKKWSSNSQEILDKIPPEDRETKSVLEFDSGGSISTLGLQCNPLSDTLSFKISLKEGAIVKRSVLSNMSRVFDPLGLLSPVTITGKIFMQKLWKENLDWDTELPEQLRDEWISYQEEILKLSALSLPRKFTPFDDVKQLQLYGFCDASQDAYAACIYARSINLNGEVSCQLIAAKTRVAPTSPLTIPRLELCGAILLVRLLKKVQKALSMEIEDIRVFSDSTIVLHWISGEASRWKTFVRNRVIKIQSEIPATNWGHVRSEDNPADLASRGVQSDVLLHNDFWFHGPQWILHDVPPPFIQKIEPRDIPAEDLEEIKVCTHFHVSNPFWNIIDRYSSLTRLVRAVGILRRFTQFITNKYKGPCHVTRGPLTATELDSARETIIKAVQAQSFAEEIQEISRGKEKKVSRDSSVRKLHPILDDRGLVRVGGRIERAETTFDHKHPILLPYKHHFTDLVAQHFHTTTLHGGPKLLLNAMRMEYWPINGMRVAKRITGRCLNCFKVKPRGVEQLMADCQTNRVRQYRPFTHTGVDYCGPFLLKPLTRKGAPPKVYISVFICLTTRAIHLEVAGSLTLEAFLAALRRFTARRGIPSHIYCDNATNFVGGSRELDQLKQQFTSEQGQNTLINTTAEMGIKFHFIPPASPTFGGSWESGVKLFKTHFRRVAGNASLTQEQMNTLVTQIEGILNSRPLTDLSTDPRDFSPLTPGHLLILGPPNETPQLNIPEPSLLHIPNNRLGHWQRVQQIVQHFWARWHREYLHSLQPRNKWMKDNPPVEVNDLVLIKQDNLPPLRWPTGRVIKVHPGDDNLVRVVSLQTPLGITQRALSKICPFPKETSMENLKSLIVISPSQDVIAHATTEPRCGK